MPCPPEAVCMTIPYVTHLIDIFTSSPTFQSHLYSNCRTICLFSDEIPGRLPIAALSRIFMALNHFLIASAGRLRVPQSHHPPIPPAPIVGRRDEFSVRPIWFVCEVIDPTQKMIVIERCDRWKLTTGMIFY